MTKDECPRKSIRTREIMDDFCGPTGQYETVEVTPCHWETRSTFSDVCTVCGRVVQYPNAHPETYNDVPVGSDMPWVKEEPK